MNLRSRDCWSKKEPWRARHVVFPGVFSSQRGLHMVSAGAMGKELWYQQCLRKHYVNKDKLDCSRACRSLNKLMSILYLHQGGIQCFPYIFTIDPFFHRSSCGFSVSWNTSGEGLIQSNLLIFQMRELRPREVNWLSKEHKPWPKSA